MRRITACLLPAVLASAGACAMRHDRNRNLPPHTDETATIKKDLAPYATPNAGPASGRVTADSDASTSGDKTDDARDRQITDEVRRAIAGDTSLSTAAKSVTITTDDGVVRLEGSVATKRERKLVADKAMQVAGVLRVDNRTNVRTER